MNSENGTIVVCGHYEADLKALCEVLNRLELTSEGEFEIYGQRIGLSQATIQDPTLFPVQWVILKDGKKWTLDEAPEEMIRKWENSDEQDVEEFSLGTLSNLIAPLIKRGSIELVACAHEDARYAYHERLIVRSDGSAERHAIRSQYDGDSTTESERYDPATAQTAAW